MSELRLTSAKSEITLLRDLRAVVLWAENTAPKVIGEASLRLIDSQFQRRGSPQGKRWAKRKPPTGTWPLLEKTGKLRAGWSVSRAVRRRVDVSQSQFYWRWLQSGTPIMVARRMLPIGGRPIPRRWAAAYREDLNASWRRDVNRLA